MATILVEITFEDPEDPEAFAGNFNARLVWDALCRAFPYSRGSHWTVQELEKTYDGISWNGNAGVGEKVGGQ